MERTSSDNRIDLLPSLMLFWRWKFWIIGAVIIAAVSAYVVTSLIPPLYESHATLLPSNSNSRDKQLEEFTYGYEIHSERLIQLLRSDIILDSLEARFHLSDHYQIDMSSLQGWDKLKAKAQDRIKFHKTRYSSVVISVTDEDPQTAADIANTIARLVNKVNSQILKVNAKQTLESASRDYEQRLGAIRSINDSIRNIQASNVTGAELKVREQIMAREARIKTMQKSLNKLRQDYQIFDFGFQVNILNEELADARATYLQEMGSLDILKSSVGIPDSTVVLASARKSGAEKRMEYFQKRLDELSRIGTEYSSLLEQLEIEHALLGEAREALAGLEKSYEPEIHSRTLASLEDDYNFDQVQIQDLKRNYQRALANYLDPVPIAHVISDARPSYKKIFPKTFVGVALTALGTFFMSLLVISLVDRLPSKQG